MKIYLTNQAKKDISSLDQITKKRILAALEKLLFFPPQGDLKKLKGTTDTWRLRVGDWRAVLRLDQEENIIYVIYIKHRKDAYR